MDIKLSDLKKTITRELVRDWIIESWKLISDKTIKNSFKCIY